MFRKLASQAFFFLVCLRYKTAFFFNEIWSKHTALILDTQNPEFSGFSTAPAFENQTASKNEAMRYEKNVSLPKKHSSAYADPWVRNSNTEESVLYFIRRKYRIYSKLPRKFCHMSRSANTVRTDHK